MKKAMTVMLLSFILTTLSSTVNSALVSKAVSQDKTVSPSSFQEKMAALETSADGRIGLYALDTGSGKQLSYRSKERFPFCSTFKTLAVSAILKKSSHDPGLMKQRIFYKKTDLVTWSPVTSRAENLTAGMTLYDLCAATSMQSDNTAANLLIKALGGPGAVTAFARSLGDDSFRLDRYETELNTAEPGDERDTTTPTAMAATLHKLALGDALAPAQREQLQIWLKNNQTGNDSIRAGMPAGWVVGDRTGAGMYGTTNAMAVLWPASGEPPRIVVIFFTQNQKNAPHRRDILAQATRIMMEEFKVP